MRWCSALAVVLCVAAVARAQDAAKQPVQATPDRLVEELVPPPPELVTSATLADAAALAALQKPGTIIGSIDFESPDPLKAFFEVRGTETGHAQVVTDAGAAHSGKAALRLTAPPNEGKSAGAGVEYWFGQAAQDRVYLRTYMKFAADYDQGNLNHTGACLSGVAGDNKWGGMGGAGVRPKGDDTFSTRFEPWCDWGRVTPPGYLFFYTYWMEMARDKDGHYWGNMIGPAGTDRVVPERGRWYCLEEMIRANTPGERDGELAGWIDGRLYVHAKGIRWRSTDAVKLKRFSLIVYIHQSRRENTVWFDDVVLSTGYVGPAKAEAAQPAAAPAKP